MNTAHLPRYDDRPIWREYQAFFPESLRCTAQSTPTEQWWRWRDLDVHLDRLPVPSSPLKVIVLHGAGAYGRVMAPAAVLAQRYGYETVTPDLPGYGLTRAHWRTLDYELWIDCVADLVEAERQRDGRPIVLFGVSLGGLLAYQVAARVAARSAPGQRPIAGLIATTLADPRERAVRRGFARHPLLGTAGLAVLRGLRRVLDNVPLPMALMSKMDGISNVPALSALVKRDRMGGGNWVPARFLRTLLTTAPDIEPERFTACPILLAHPGNDHMTDIALSRRFFERLPGSERGGAGKRMVVLDGASHMPTERTGLDQLEAAAVGFLRGLGTAAHAPQTTNDPGPPIARHAEAETH